MKKYNETNQEYDSRQKQRRKSWITIDIRENSRVYGQADGQTDRQTVCFDEVLPLETSATHQLTPQAKIIP